MKKAFLGISAAALAAVMCVAFAGCGEGADAKEVKGETVTAEQWDEAFAAFEKDDAKYTVKLSGGNTSTVSVAQSEGEKSGATVTVSEAGTFINNVTKQSMTTEITTSIEGDFSIEEIATLLHMDVDTLNRTEEEVEYAERDASGKYTVYEKDDAGEWETSGGSSLSPMIYYDQKGDFDNYKYDETLMGYVDTDYKADDTEYIVYKFDKQGNLVAIYIHEEYSEDMDSIVISFVTELSFTISYTAEDITLPNVEA